MALINCPDCGEKVSDSAPACPHCGRPLMNTPPPPPVAKSGHPAQGAVGLEAKALRCPNCGETLQAKDIMSSGWAHCPSCGSDVALTGVNNQFVDDGIIEKIIPFCESKEEFHRRCMQTMMEVAPEDFFSNTCQITVKKKYIWVREFGNGPYRQIFPMDKYGEAFIKSISGDSPAPTNDVYDKWWSFGDMQEFSNSIAAGAEIMPKDISAKECKHRYSIAPGSRGYAEKDCYYCLPVYEETFVYGGTQYRATGLGTKGIPEIHWDSRPLDSKYLHTSPTYFTATPVLYTAIAILGILALIIVVSAFSSGFWSGLFILIGIGLILGFIGAILGAVLMIPIVALDKIIQLSINTARRRKFRQRYAEIQKRKQSEARKYMNLDFDYEIPEFPLP